MALLAGRENARGKIIPRRLVALRANLPFSLGREIGGRPVLIVNHPDLGPRRLALVAPHHGIGRSRRAMRAPAPL
jgi:hypothetical protein